MNNLNEYKFKLKPKPKPRNNNQGYVATIHAVSLGQAHTILKQSYSQYTYTQV